MDLIFRGMLIPETKLMIGNEISFLDDDISLLSKRFSNNFDIIGSKSRYIVKSLMQEKFKPGTGN
jgi:hypothetical protein